MNPILSLRRYSQQTIDHSHDHVQLVFGLRGELVMEIDGRGAQVQPERFAVVPVGARHACDSHAGSLCLVLDVPGGHWLSSRLGERAGAGLRLFERPAQHPLSAAQQRLIGWLADSAVEDGALAQQGAALLLTSLVEPAAAVSTPARLEALLRYIDQHLAYPLGITDLAQQAGLSPSRLHAAFLAGIGCSPMTYVRQRRLERGRQLLSETTRPVSDIAAAVGYASQSAFTAALGRAYGTTPRRVRQEMRDKIRQ